MALADRAPAVTPLARALNTATTTTTSTSTSVPVRYTFPCVSQALSNNNERAAAKKIEMFNLHELALFRRVGLTPVFFGETLVGPLRPNLTYMLVFPDDAAREMLSILPSAPYPLLNGDLRVPHDTKDLK